MSAETDRALAPLRLRGGRIVVFFIWVNVLAIVPTGLIHNHGDTWLVLALGLANAALPTWLIWRRQNDGQSRYVLCLALILFPMLYVYLFRGDPWQMEMHMYFFVCFSLMVLLCDPRPIILAAAVTILHHVLFYFFAPSWVLPYTGGISRMLFHGFLVSCEVAILIAVIRQITEQTVETRKAQDDTEAAREQAEEARMAAEQALEAARVAELRAETENRSRLLAEAELKSASDRRRLVTADDIEASIGALISDLGTVAAHFNHQALDITSVSGLLADEAQALRVASEDAMRSITSMAANSEQLADSIRVVGRNAHQAQDVAAATASAIAKLGPGIAVLSQEVDAAQSILQMVSNIANQSNLLALNASIEAARSGDAGRGFAVVAGEMKQMAVATSRAASEISQKLRGIVAAADAFRLQLDMSTGRVDEITDSSSAITAAGEEQQGATEAIARGADAVFAKVSQTDSRSHRLNEAAGRNRAIADTTIKLADQLDERSRALKARMEGLLLQLRAA